MRPKFARAVQRLVSARFEPLAPLTVGLVVAEAPKKPAFALAVLAMFTLSPFIFTFFIPPVDE